MPKGTVQRSALKHLTDVFFAGSAADAMAALLDEVGDGLTTAELDRLESLINEKRDPE